MPPDHINSNLWELREGETVEGAGGVIKGPKIVRVHEFPDQGKLSVQAGPISVEVDGSDFEAAVKSASDSGKQSEKP